MDGVYYREAYLKRSDGCREAREGWTTYGWRRAGGWAGGRVLIVSLQDNKVQQDLHLIRWVGDGQGRSQRPPRRGSVGCGGPSGGRR